MAGSRNPQEIYDEALAALGDLHYHQSCHPVTNSIGWQTTWSPEEMIGIAQSRIDALKRQPFVNESVITTTEHDLREQLGIDDPDFLRINSIQIEPRGHSRVDRSRRQIVGMGGRLGDYARTQQDLRRSNDEQQLLIEYQLSKLPQKRKQSFWDWLINGDK